MMMSNLPRDLVEEILSRVPLASLKTVRSTCKKWNALTKDQSFANKHIRNVATSGEREFMMIMEYKVYLIGVNIHDNNSFDLSIKLKGTLISLDNSDELYCRSQVFHCHGLLLFVCHNRLVLWNPYWGKPKCIKRKYVEIEMFALGYDKSCGSHKILRLFGYHLKNMEIYDLSCDSWMVPSGNLERDMVYMRDGVSLKGNTYWCGMDKESVNCQLLCFDFTRERFGPRLLLPIKGFDVSLSVVKEEQLAVLIKRYDKSAIEIWVTNKIEPDAVSWNIFLKFDMNLCRYVANFLIDEEKKVAVLFDTVRAGGSYKLKLTYTNIAYIIGENGCFRRVDLGESLHTPPRPLACSYVPSSVQIK
ncbi:F-box associated domain type 1 [Arabidopsis suecica]|uniref:F-box associated domain type 1 n=1 Tax=Arabidopsis suecica TaxID=45249 RepID=A0A8T2BFN1_ARASU|nr:F-box associated domain type 1 [Arabidopsis suecica]